MTRIQTTIIAMLIMLACTLAGPVAAQTAADEAGATAEPRIIVVQPAPTPAPPEVTERDLNHLKETLRDGLAMQDKLDQERTSSLKEIIAEQDKRIVDLQTYIGWLIAAMGAVFVLAGMLTYWKVKTEAHVQAKEASKEWMDEHAEDVADALEKRYIEKIESRLKRLEKQAEERLARLSRLISDAAQQGKKENVSQDQVNEFNEAVEDIEKMPENERGFDDWFAIATHYYFDGQYQDAIKTLRRAIESDDASSSNIATALLNIGVALRHEGDHKAEIATYDEVVRRFGDAEELELRERVASALFSKAYAHGKEGDIEAENAAYDEVVRRFGNAEAPELREQVAKALVNKGVAHSKAGDPTAALAAYDEVVRRFGEAEAPELSLLVAQALVNKAVAHDRAGDSIAAIATHEEILRRFGDAKVPEVREQVASTLSGSGDVRRNQAKVLWQDKNKEGEAQKLLTLTLQGLDKALDSGFDHVVQQAAANKAYALFLLGADEDVVAGLLRQSLKLGGQKIFDDILEDIAKHRLPQDDDYQALVERVWAEVLAEQGDADDA